MDVLVVGLGPAGSRAAAEAVGAGLEVLAVDGKRRAGTPVQCAEFVPALMSQEIPQLGRVTRQRIAEMITYLEDATEDREPRFPGRMIDRDRFDAALAGMARARGAQLRFGVRVEHVTADGEAALSDGTRVRPRVIVGADGPRSRVGRAVGRCNRELVVTRQVTVPLHVPHDATDIFLGGDFPGGYGWLFPKDRVANVGCGVVPREKARLRAGLSALHADLIGAGRVGEEILGMTGGPIPVGGPLDPHARLGQALVLLAGDAAGLTHPITGAGIPAAVISGTLAGETAAAWVDGDTDAADDYAVELDSLFGSALGRGLARRRELMAGRGGTASPSPAALRRAWIAYPEYWAA
jgi:geranylgeranyl reductase family protein